jgi:hypothetical protein
LSSAWKRRHIAQAAKFRSDLPSAPYAVAYTREGHFDSGDLKGICLLLVPKRRSRTIVSLPTARSVSRGPLRRGKSAARRHDRLPLEHRAPNGGARACRRFARASRVAESGRLYYVHMPLYPAVQRGISDPIEQTASYDGPHIPAVMISEIVVPEKEAGTAFLLAVQRGSTLRLRSRLRPFPLLLSAGICGGSYD